MTVTIKIEEKIPAQKHSLPILQLYNYAGFFSAQGGEGTL